MTVTPKKDTKFEVVQDSKGIFSRKTKINFKASSLIEMEDWIKTITKFDA